MGSKRWTLARLKEWWQHTKGNINDAPDSMLPVPLDARIASTSGRFHKAPPLDRLVKAFGLEVGAGSELIGKFIGPHTTEDNVKIEGLDKVLDLRHMAGATVLFIDRGPTVGVVTLPKATDQVQKGDWIYYLVQ